MDALIVFGLGVLGMMLYSVYQVWSKIRQEGFSPKKFFIDNNWFWLTGVGLMFLIALTTMFVPEITEIIEHLGFAVDTSTRSGWVLLGGVIAAGNDGNQKNGIKSLKEKFIKG